MNSQVETDIRNLDGTESLKRMLATALIDKKAPLSNGEGEEIYGKYVKENLK